MEQINYDKLQYDTTNKHFMMIKPPGQLREHFPTLIDRY